ncbi:MAG: YjgN family protein [Gammaproteobacteria bacterium]
MALELSPLAQRPHVAQAQASSPNAAEANAAAALDEGFQFTGTGSEYFRIWIVNLLLTVVTLGVYSAWAKVRRLQYFYRNTRVAGSTFYYHGKPGAILKGRVLAVGMVIAFKVALGVSPKAGALTGAVLLLVFPWLLARSFRFRMANSSYRGLRLRFTGTTVQAYRELGWLPLLLGLMVVLVAGAASVSGWFVMVIGMLAVLVLLVLMVPLIHYGLKNYQHNHTYFGHMPFFSYMQKRQFVSIYLRGAALLLLGSVTAGAFTYLTRPLYLALSGGTFGWLVTLLYGMLNASAFYLLVRPYLESRIQNTVWSGTELGTHLFFSQASARKLCLIHATNLALIMLTLGLYKPFATIRLLKYRIESASLQLDGNLEDFLADQVGDNSGAIGQEAGDLFDLEIAL